MQTKDVEGWTVPIYEIPLAGSCRLMMKSKYRDWNRLKATLFQIQERKILIDVGANFGLVTVPAMKYFKKVISIEPHPITAYCLRENVSKTKGKAEVIEAVASTQKGTTLLYDPPNQYTSGYSSIIPKKDWVIFTHLIIDHGRAICIARRPQCNQCIIFHFHTRTNQFVRKPFGISFF